MADLKVTEIIDEICELSKNESGEIARLPFTDPWAAAGTYLKKLFEKLGFDTYYDGAGNLHGRLGGPGKTIMTGSHADTVKNGGKYDGLYGVVASALAVSRLYKAHGMPKTALEVVAFSEEEGSRFPFNFFGSKALVGDVPWDEFKSLIDKEGINILDAMQSKGFAFTPDCALRNDIKTFVEAHIEQGGVLERTNNEIGVVTSIVGQKRFIIEIFGEANHAGTTPMAYRKDAGFCAAQIINKVVARAKEFDDILVTTVGQIELKPNNANVVPAYAKFSLDMRHPCSSALDSFKAEFLDIVKTVTADTKTTYDILTTLESEPVNMDDSIMEIISESCEKRQIAHMKIHSGAGHDSQIMAKIAPVAMIFVPSQGGISHNPAEFTEAKQLETGIDILEDVLFKLAY